MVWQGNPWQSIYIYANSHHHHHHRDFDLFGASLGLFFMSNSTTLGISQQSNDWRIWNILISLRSCPTSLTETCGRFHPASFGYCNARNWRPKKKRWEKNSKPCRRWVMDTPLLGMEEGLCDRIVWSCFFLVVWSYNGNLSQFCSKILLCCFVGVELVYFDNCDITSATMLPVMDFKGGEN